MPDIIRPALVDSTVVVTISSVADQSTLNAVSPTVSATVDGLAATITAWAWKVNGATTGITGPTTATPSYTPTTAGAKIITVDVTILGVVYSSLPEIFVVGPTALSVSIAAVSDQLDLSAATLDSTVTGGVSPYTYAWTVDGATTGLSSSTAADPTYTPTGAGTPTAVVTVTDAAGQTTKASVTWRVGNAAGWVCVWSSSGITDHDHKVTATKTHNGVDLVGYPGATWPTFAWSSGTLTIDTTAGTNGGLTVKIGGVVPATLTGYEIALIFGLGAEITADNDGFFAQYSSIGGTNCIVEARRDAGAQKVKIEALSANTSRNTAGGLQARIIGMQLTPGRTGFRPIYSTSAWSGANGPEPDSLTAGGGTPSGWHSACTLATSASADLFTPDGATQDWVWFAPRSDNGRLFTIPGMAVWVKSPTSLS